jgi:hypothetical protein
MAINETLVNASKAANQAKLKATADFSGLSGADSAINKYLDHKMDMKFDEEKRKADEEYQEYLKQKEEKENEKIVEKTIENSAESPNEENDIVSSLQMKTPFTYNQGLVNAASKLYKNRRYANNALGNALAKSGTAIDGSIQDMMDDFDLEAKLKKEEERLKEEAAQAEKDRQLKIIDDRILESNKNNLSQHGSKMYNEVQDQLYSLRDEYLRILDEDPKNTRALNNIRTELTKLDGQLTSFSTGAIAYDQAVQEDNFSAGMDKDTKNLLDAYYTHGDKVEIEGKDWTFEKKYIDGEYKMVIQDPSSASIISELESKIQSLEEQKGMFSEEEYNTAMASHKEELYKYKRILDPKKQFTASSLVQKVDGSPLNNFYSLMEKTSNAGRVITKDEITGTIRSLVKDKASLISYANDPIPGQGKSMREHFQEMFPEGVPIEKENGVVEYVTIDQIFNAQNPYFRENQGQKVLEELVVDYYTRIGINKFNKQKVGNADIISVENDYGSTTFGLSREEGDKFRSWIHENYPDYAEEIDLDKSYKSFTNKYIATAWEKYGEEYQKAMAGQRYDDIITKYNLED